MSRTVVEPARRGPHLVDRAGYVTLVVALLVGLVAAVVVAVGAGTVPVPVGDVVRVVWSHLTGGAGPTGEGAELTDQIVWDFRVPRVLLAALAGAGLSVAGVCLQNLVRNPLADPYIIGTAAGASLGERGPDEVEQCA